MKTLRLALLPFLLMAIPGSTFAQDATSSPAADAAPSAAQAAFERLKSLTGSWVATLTTSPQDPGVLGKLAQLSLRETSLGNALVHEISVSGLPDHPVTMFYLEDDRLMLTHYCDAGNRPRMVGKISPDGKTVEFDFLDLYGDDRHGHMHRARFTFVDEDRHIEEWTWMLPGGNPVEVRLELQRTNFGSGVAGQ